MGVGATGHRWKSEGNLWGVSSLLQSRRPQGLNSGCGFAITLIGLHLPPPRVPMWLEKALTLYSGVMDFIPGLLLLSVIAGQGRDLMQLGADSAAPFQDSRSLWWIPRLHPENVLLIPGD